MTSLAFPFDIKTEGRKIWDEMHIKALNAKREDQKEEYDRYIIKLQQEFSCLECREHFGEYINSDPPWNYREYRDKHGEDIGYFYWSWKFHESVNRRLKKKGFSFEKSLEYYRRKVCTSSEKDKLICAIAIIDKYKSGKIGGRPLLIR